MSKVNVLLANDHLGFGNTIHGVARLFSLWIPKFDASRFKVTVCILRKKDRIGEKFEREFEKLGVRIRFFERGKYDPRTLIDFIKVIREENIDIMHLQGYGSSTFGRVAKILTGVPVIIHFHDTNPYYPWFQKVADRLLDRVTNVAIAVSNSVKRFCAENNKISPEKVIVLYNCISLEQIKCQDPARIEIERKLLGIESDYKIVGTITRLFEQKGNRYFLEAATEVLKIYPKTKFLIVGDGPLYKELKDLSVKLGIENNVIFTGFCEDPIQKLSTFDVKVLPSIFGEGIPLTILEAMVVGKPIVTTNIVEIIKDGVTGLIVPIRDSKALAQKILILLENEKFALRLGTNAQMESKNYDVNIYIRKLEQIYSEIVQKGRITNHAFM